MKQAEKFGRAVITFVDTPGAFCGLEAEERGQGEASAEPWRSSLRSPWPGWSMGFIKIWQQGTAFRNVPWLYRQPVLCFTGSICFHLRYCHYRIYVHGLQTFFIKARRCHHLAAPSMFFFIQLVLIRWKTRITAWKPLNYYLSVGSIDDCVNAHFCNIVSGNLQWHEASPIRQINALVCSNIYLKCLIHCFQFFQKLLLCSAN